MARMDARADEGSALNKAIGVPAAVRREVVERLSRYHEQAAKATAVNPLFGAMAEAREI